uniref:Uncharacterized protein n=1 Tax=Spironucleus salmonicida TaxID=348837 RepID=V6LU69_9EUKA|eukprot:EST44349.1 Hypothetical protein SS50377_15820 [Spironucleus salmonicida]
MQILIVLHAYPVLSWKKIRAKSVQITAFNEELIQHVINSSQIDFQETKLNAYNAGMTAKPVLMIKAAQLVLRNSNYPIINAILANKIAQNATLARVRNVRFFLV